MTEILPVITALSGTLLGSIGTWLAIRKDQRDARNQVLHEANTTIDLLKEQNETLRTSLSNAEQREARLEARVAELEREYRNLIRSISAMGMCKDPSNCPVSKLHES